MRLLLRGTAPPTVDRWTEGRERLAEVTVLPTPGHTPGRVAVLWRGWLLAGDALVTGDRFRFVPWPFTMDRSTARRSVENLLNEALEGASSSHGPAVA